MKPTKRPSRDPAHLRLGVNIDHVATIRNARGGRHPDPLRAAHLAVAAGADGITAHLREDRRHISDADIARLKQRVDAAAQSRDGGDRRDAGDCLAARAPRLLPRPRKTRGEARRKAASTWCAARTICAITSRRLKAAGIRVSLFIEPDPRAIEASSRLGAQVVELHTGAYCERALEDDAAGLARELERLQRAAQAAPPRAWRCTPATASPSTRSVPWRALPRSSSSTSATSSIGEAIFSGLAPAIERMRTLMDEARVHAGAPDRAKGRT